MTRYDTTHKSMYTKVALVLFFKGKKNRYTMSMNTLIGDWLIFYGIWMSNLEFVYGALVVFLLLLFDVIGFSNR